MNISICPKACVNGKLRKSQKKRGKRGPLIFSLSSKIMSATPTSLLLRSQFWEWRSGVALKRVALFNTTIQFDIVSNDFQFRLLLKSKAPGWYLLFDIDKHIVWGCGKFGSFAHKKQNIFPLVDTI